MPSLSLEILEERFAVCQLPAGAAVPSWAIEGDGFCSITRAPGELSIVTSETNVAAGTVAESGWRCFRLEGKFSFELTGILAAVANPLRDAGIGIFAISTFDTDYVLVKEEKLDASVAALEAAGHLVNRAQ